MFLENTVNHEEPFGWIEVICGSMFSGKTEELIRRLKRAQFAKQRIEIFKPQIDTRYHDEMVVSHDENQIRSTPVPAAANIRILADQCDVVGIDEAQFFDAEIINDELYFDYILKQGVCKNMNASFLLKKMDII